MQNADMGGRYETQRGTNTSLDSGAHIDNSTDNTSNEDGLLFRDEEDTEADLRERMQEGGSVRIVPRSGTDVVVDLVRTIVGGGDVMATAVRLKKLLADARQRHEENTVLFGDEDFTQRDRVIAREAYERIQDLIDSLRTNPAEAERIGLNLNDAVKIVNVYYPDMRKKQNDTKNFFCVVFVSQFCSYLFYNLACCPTRTRT